MRYYRASALMVQVLGPSAASQHVHVDFTASRFSNLTCKALTELQKEFGYMEVSYHDVVVRQIDAREAQIR